MVPTGARRPRGGGAVDGGAAGHGRHPGLRCGRSGARRASSPTRGALVNAAVEIARVSLVRVARDRSNLFFLVVFPLLLVLLLGVAFGGEQSTRVGVVVEGGGDGGPLVERLRDTDVEVALLPDEATLRTDVSRGFLSAGVVVPELLSARLPTVDDGPVSVPVVVRPDAPSLAVQATLEGVVADLAAVATSIDLAIEIAGVDAATAAAASRLVAAGLPDVEVRTTAVGAGGLDEEFAGLGRFDLGASSQLFLFTFLSGLVAGAALIETRTLGVARRVLATPTGAGAVLLGFAGGRVVMAWAQALYIVVASRLLFGVDWGDPLATSAVVVVFGLAAGGAGTLLGATLRNESQASGAAVGLGLGLAALGGSMVPLEVFPASMRAAARLTPHAWANEAMAEIVRRDGGVLDVLPQLAVLTGFAGSLLAAGTWALRRTLTR
ncbi:ABC transporter permease [Nitriliruptoraceae bacterium ZYF776]|nr:ABC transporter permease [Profundirhabdus halotolerans]